MHHLNNTFSFYSSAKSLSSYVHVLWPMTRFDFKIVSPVLPSVLNLFERVVLKLIGLNISTTYQLAELTCLDERLIKTICQRLVDFDFVKANPDFACDAWGHESLSSKSMRYNLTSSGVQEFKRLQDSTDNHEDNSGSESADSLESFYILREDLNGCILPYTLRLNAINSLGPYSLSTLSSEPSQAHSGQDFDQDVNQDANQDSKPNDNQASDQADEASLNTFSVGLHYLTYETRNNVPVYRFGSATSDDWLDDPVILTAPAQDTPKLLLPTQVGQVLRKCKETQHIYEQAVSQAQDFTVAHLLPLQNQAGNVFAQQVYVQDDLGDDRTAHNLLFRAISHSRLYVHCVCTVDRKVLDPCGLPEYSRLLTEILRKAGSENSLAFERYISQHKDKLSAFAALAKSESQTKSAPQVEAVANAESAEHLDNLEASKQTDNQDLNAPSLRPELAISQDSAEPSAAWMSLEDEDFKQDMLTLAQQYVALVSAEQSNELQDQEKPFADLTIMLYNYYDFTLRDLLTIVKAMLPSKVQGQSSQDICYKLQWSGPYDNGKLLTQAEKRLGFENLDLNVSLPTNLLMQAWEENVNSPAVILALIILLIDHFKLSKSLALLDSSSRIAPYQRLRQLQSERNAASHAERFSGDMQSARMLDNWQWLGRLMQVTYEATSSDSARTHTQNLGKTTGNTVGIGNSNGDSNGHGNGNENDSSTGSEISSSTGFISGTAPGTAFMALSDSVLGTDTSIGIAIITGSGSGSSSDTALSPSNDLDIETSKAPFTGQDNALEESGNQLAQQTQEQQPHTLPAQEQPELNFQIASLTAYAQPGSGSTVEAQVAPTNEQSQEQSLEQKPERKPELGQTAEMEQESEPALKLGQNFEMRQNYARGLGQGPDKTMPNLTSRLSYAHAELNNAHPLALEYLRLQVLKETLQQLQEQQAIVPVWTDQNQIYIWLNERFSFEEIQTLHHNIYHVAQDNLNPQGSGKGIVSNLYQVSQDLLLKLIEQSPNTQASFEELQSKDQYARYCMIRKLATRNAQNSGLWSKTSELPRSFSSSPNYVLNALAKDSKHRNTTVNAACLVFLLLTPTMLLKKLQDCKFVETMDQLLQMRKHNQEYIERQAAMQLQIKLFRIFRTLLHLWGQTNIELPMQS